MMDEKEMIEVLEAYQRGEIVEYKDKTKKCKWKPIAWARVGWDFKHYDYRIKPKKKKVILNDIPFKKGEMYIHKEDINKYFVDTRIIYLVTNIEKYDDSFEVTTENLSGNFGKTITINRCEKESRLDDYLNIHDDSLLWYWEYEDKEDGHIAYTSFRDNYKNALEWCEVSNTKLLNPLFGLGCVRDTKDKESK